MVMWSPGLSRLSGSRATPSSRAGLNACALVQPAGFTRPIIHNARHSFPGRRWAHVKSGRNCPFAEVDRPERRATEGAGLSHSRHARHGPARGRQRRTTRAAHRRHGVHRQERGDGFGRVYKERARKGQDAWSGRDGMQGNMGNGDPVADRRQIAVLVDSPIAGHFETKSDILFQKGIFMGLFDHQGRGLDLAFIFSRGWTQLAG
jgi:hypothetical protein